MPTLEDTMRPGPNHHWPVGSPQAQQLAREQRERELAMYEAAQAEFARRLTEASAPAARAEPQPETSNENGAA